MSGKELDVGTRGGQEQGIPGELAPVCDQRSDDVLGPAAHRSCELPVDAVGPEVGRVPAQEPPLVDLIGVDAVGPAVQAHAVDDGLVRAVLVVAAAASPVTELDAERARKNRSVSQVFGDQNEGSVNVRAARDVPHAAAVENGDAGSERTAADQREVDAAGGIRQGQGSP
ncbi:hypothetical protein ACIOG4_28655 [Streptomyces microflavus]|uniref:hypothetical protein n=1 Tax=Streptomyces microflavus TaxID=1919 RepID=UPI00382E5989